MSFMLSLVVNVSVARARQIFRNLATLRVFLDWIHIYALARSREGDRMSQISS